MHSPGTKCVVLTGQHSGMGVQGDIYRLVLVCEDEVSLPLFQELFYSTTLCRKQLFSSQ